MDATHLTHSPNGGSRLRHHPESVSPRHASRTITPNPARSKPKSHQSPTGGTAHTICSAPQVEVTVNSSL